MFTLPEVDLITDKYTWMVPAVSLPKATFLALRVKRYGRSCFDGVFWSLFVLDSPGHWG